MNTSITTKKPGIISAYGLACGYVQRREFRNINSGNQVEITLWKEHSVYHIRFYNRMTANRIELSRRTLKSARYEFNTFVKHYKKGIIS